MINIICFIPIVKSKLTKKLCVGLLLSHGIAMASQAAELEEVLVSAQKREQSLQDVPVSISAYGEDLLSGMNAADFSDFADSVPGATFAASGVGNSLIFIRGIGQVQAAQSPTTGIYFDEVPLQIRAEVAASAPDLQLMDVSRVEVLRGPQGSLYGSSSMGGLVRIVSNKPNLSEMEGMVESGYGVITDGAESWHMGGMINIPLKEDVLAVRIVGKRGLDGGWIDDLRPVTRDVYENLNNPNAIEEDANWYKNQMTRIAFGYSPDESISITPSVHYQNTEGNSDAQHTDLTFGVESRLKARYQDVSVRDTLSIYNLTIQKDWENASLVSSSSYLDRTHKRNFDSSPFRSGQIEALIGPSPAGQLYPSGFNTVVTTEQFTQEIRLASAGDSPWQYITGVFFRTADQDSDLSRPTFYTFGVPVTGAFGASNPSTLEETRTLFEEQEYAVFGEVSYDLTDKMTFSLGGRFFKYEQTDTQVRYGIGGVEAGPELFSFSEDGSDSGFTPRAVLTYQANEDINIYSSISKGFRTGGVNRPITEDICSDQDLEGSNLERNPPPFKSDNTENYEIGIKSTWADGRLNLNGATYFIKWKDYQQAVQAVCGPNPFSFISNAGEVESKGFELETAFQATDEFLVSAGVSYTDAVYIEPFVTLGLPAGSSLLDVPKLTWNIRAEYSTNVIDDWYAGVSLAANYVDDTVSGFAEGEPEPRADYTLVDFRAFLENDSVELSLYVDNVFDETPVYGVEFASDPENTTSTSWFAAHTGQPRTVGIVVKKNF
jgi:iron complex outermembrane recepter protein